MSPEQSLLHPVPRSTGSTAAPNAAVSDLSLLVRNYDGERTHAVDVRFVDADGEVTFDRSVTVGPLETVTVRTRLERAVYRVEADLADGQTAAAECLVGSGLDEVALVETGNGIVSVAEGLF